MGETNLKKLYRGIIIGLIVAVVPLFLLGSIQLIFGVKVSKDNAIAIQKIHESYMRTDLFERWVVLMEERTLRNTKCIEKSVKENEEQNKEINELYNELKIKSYGRSRGAKIDTTNITFNGIF